MLNGQANYGDTFSEGRLASQKAIERRLVQGARFYSARRSTEFMQGYISANKIVKDGFAPTRTNGV